MNGTQEYLAHYGILGMKWGVRRSERQLARARGERIKKGKPVTKTKTAEKRAKKYSEDAAAAKESLKKAKKGGASALTNKELKALNERLNLEQNYSRLTADKKSAGKVKKGKKFVNEVIDTGRMANDVYKLANSPLVKDVRAELSGSPSKKARAAGERQMRINKANRAFR